MDGFEFNKIAGAVLSALLVIFAGRTLFDILDPPHPPSKPGWALPVTEVANAAAPKEAAAPFDAKEVVALLPKANAEAGQDVFKRCLQCHTPQKGGPNLVGPNLWGVVGREIAKHGGFPYSEAMKAHAGSWTWEQLATYIHDPKGAVPGNKMAFPGIKDNAQLADLLAYIRKLSDNPQALPQ
jgi:cytochrome c